MMALYGEHTLRGERIREARANATKTYFGPDIGEFAFSVMMAAVWRKLAEACEHVIVCSRPDRKYLYQDFCHEFIGHTLDCHGDCVTARPCPPAKDIEKWIPQGIQVVRPKDYGDKLWPGKYIVYGEINHQWDGAIVVHARNRPYCEWRNWPVEYWHRLGRWLGRNYPQRRVVCIGTKTHAIAIERALDMRGADLGSQATILRTAGATGGFAFGPSSGPLHFATHCRCPVGPVWCGGDPGEMERTSRWYRETWNPHKVRAATYLRGDWTPPYEDVEMWLEQFITERS